MSAKSPTATFVLSIQSTTGYEAQTEGICTPEQYGAAIAALHGKPTPAEKELLEALIQAEAGLEFAGADAPIPAHGFVPTKTLALRIVRATLAKFKGGAA